jgi:hypothetical protein
MLTKASLGLSITIAMGVASKVYGHLIGSDKHFEIAAQIFIPSAEVNSR